MRLLTPGGAAGSLALTLTWVAAAHAQLRPGFVPEVEDVVEQGDRVRVTSELASGEFVVSGVGAQELMLRAQPDIKVAITSLSDLQVHRGRQISRLEGVFGGGFVGGLLGGALGLQGAQPHYVSLSGGISLKESVALGVGLGALVGLVVSRMSDEVWEEVALAHRPAERPRQVATPAGADRVDPVIIVGDAGSGDLVELTVRNRSPDPIDAYAWWEGGARVSLGLVRANSTSTFITARRSTGVLLVVSPVSSPGPPRGPAPRSSQFIVVAPDERLEWVVLESGVGVVSDYLRLTPR
jgi:hypothetical protein